MLENYRQPFFRVSNNHWFITNSKKYDEDDLEWLTCSGTFNGCTLDTNKWTRIQVSFDMDNTMTYTIRSYGLRVDE